MGKHAFAGRNTQPLDVTHFDRSHNNCGNDALLNTQKNGMSEYLLDVKQKTLTYNTFLHVVI